MLKHTHLFCDNLYQSQDKELCNFSIAKKKKKREKVNQGSTILLLNKKKCIHTHRIIYVNLFKIWLTQRLFNLKVHESWCQTKEAWRLLCIQNCHGLYGEGGEGGSRGSLRIGRKVEIPKRFVQDFPKKNNIIIIGKFSKSTIIPRKSSTASVNQLFQI